MEDHEIVRLYFERDERAISETAAKYGAYCTKIAVNILSSREDAEECVNESWLHAWNAIPPHRPRILATFLGKIVRRLSFNRYQFLHAEKRGGCEVSAVLDELAEIVSDGESAEDSVIRRELIAQINAFLRSLPEEKRRMFLRRYWYSDSIAEIAARFGKRENAVSAALSRMRKELRAYLQERGYEL
ncbi:MAG: RNA polymerase sigma factor [Oscillospiraceae bacterium]|nr:RNA polymerase sigma factor [Oscillospiraceae bacterium]